MVKGLGVDLKALGIENTTKEKIMAELRRIYCRHA